MIWFGRNSFENKADVNYIGCFFFCFFFVGGGGGLFFFFFFFFFIFAFLRFKVYGFL